MVKYGPTIALVTMWALFSLLTPRFLTMSNLRDIVAQSSIPLILAVGLTFVIIAGMIDLSVEGVMAVSAVAVSLLVLNNRNDLDLG
ncbi:MAG: ABC transporter permease subunit, partial [Chloroflexota bacterium]